MTTRFHRILGATMLVAAFPAGLAAQIPDWYSTHTSARYPADRYVIGVGAGSGDKAIDAAKKAAQTDLVSQIRVQVQAQIRSVSESYQLNKNEQLYSEVRSNIRTAVSDEITGMEVAETVTDDASGIAYALVVLDRDKYSGNLRDELDAGWKQAAGLRSASSDDAVRGKLNDALQNLVDARSAVPPLLTKQTLYNAVSNTPYKPPVDFGPATISSDIRSILSDVKLVKKSGDNQRGRIGEHFPQPFVVQATILRNGTQVPLAGSTVVFETPDKTAVGETTTDERGLAGFTMIVRAMSGSGVRARISFKKLDREFEQNIAASAVTFSWKADPSNVAFALAIETKSTKAASSLKKSFSSSITELGYKVVNSSDYVLRLSIEAGQSSRVDGMTGTMYSLSATVVATLVRKGGENPIGAVTFTGKGLARSEAEALDKAVGSVKIGQREFSDLLGKASQN